MTHLVITDSGLGGLSICAAIEKAVRESGAGEAVRLTYVNAWPEEGRGYNDLPDAPARAAVFDRVLTTIETMAPDVLLIACNTLSILHPMTRHHASTTVSVQGIIDAGADLFQEALAASPSSALVLVGTRTTIESGAHRDRLLQRGVETARIGGASCHGLATAIERGPSSADTAALIATCAHRAAEAAPAGDSLFLGLCCTHFGMVADRIVVALAARTGRHVEALDPNARLVRDIMPRLLATSTGGGMDVQRRPTRAVEGAAPVPRRSPKGEGGSVPVDAGRAVVEVVSKVTLTGDQRAAVADILARVSPATADALRHYAHVPDLF